MDVSLNGKPTLVHVLNVFAKQRHGIIPSLQIFGMRVLEAFAKGGLPFGCTDARVRLCSSDTRPVPAPVHTDKT